MNDRRFGQFLEKKMGVLSCQTQTKCSCWKFQTNVNGSLYAGSAITTGSRKIAPSGILKAMVMSPYGAAKHNRYCTWQHVA